MWKHFMNVDEGVKVAEKALKRILRICQKTISTSKAIVKYDNELGPEARDAHQACQTKWERIENYIHHAFATLPSDPLLRLSALAEHHGTIEWMSETRGSPS
jgi:hypothetical protein